MTRLFLPHSGSKRDILALTRIALLALVFFLVAFLASVQERFWHHSSCELARIPMTHADIARSSGSMPTALETPLVPMTNSDDDRDDRDHPEIFRRSGENWTLWDRKSVLHSDLNRTCRWAPFRPSHTTGVVPDVRMCVHHMGDRDVSHSIVYKGRWPDCDGLTPILQNSQTRKKTKRIHVEIGAHIGSCVMQILLTTNAEVYAFEPHPVNLFHFTSTLMDMGEEYRNRVHLFPVALASESGFSRVVTNKKNMGNAQVQRTGATRGRRGFTIPIERLDDLLDMRNHPISLMKMDAQGYECKVLGGMNKTLQFTKNLVFEVEHKQLIRFEDCSPSLLVNRVKDSGFMLHRMKIEGKDDNADADLPDFDNFQDKDAVDLVAKRE